jgi:hypothetical protein
VGVCDGAAEVGLSELGLSEVGEWEVGEWEVGEHEEGLCVAMESVWMYSMFCTVPKSKIVPLISAA